MKEQKQSGLRQQKLRKQKQQKDQRKRDEWFTRSGSEEIKAINDQVKLDKEERCKTFTPTSNNTSSKHVRVFEANQALIKDVMLSLGLDVKNVECPACGRVRGKDSCYTVSVVVDFHNCITCHADDCGQVFKPVRLVMEEMSITKEEAAAWIVSEGLI